MEENFPEYEEVCDECGQRTKMKFVERNGEFLVYECSVCGNKEELSKEEVEEKFEEVWKE